MNTAPFWGGPANLHWGRFRRHRLQHAWTWFESDDPYMAAACRRVDMQRGARIDFHSDARMCPRCLAAVAQA